MKQVHFSKYCGAGRDFILIDNRDGRIPPHREELVSAMVPRRKSIGADGVILLENSEKADIRMKLFGFDGALAEMCGNSARCLIAFAKKIGIEKDEYTFEIGERVLRGRFVGNEVEVELGPSADTPLEVSLDVDGSRETVHCISTRTPHAVLFVDDVEKVDVIGSGKAMASHRRFQPEGVNVDFVEVYDDDYVKLRTYERETGMEAPACGTGTIAAAIVAHLVRGVKNPVWLLLRSNEILRVDFERDGEAFENILLRGSASLIYDGVFYYDR